MRGPLQVILNLPGINTEVSIQRWIFISLTDGLAPQLRGIVIMPVGKKEVAQEVLRVRVRRVVSERLPQHVSFARPVRENRAKIGLHRLRGISCPLIPPSLGPGVCGQVVINQRRNLARFQIMQSSLEHKSRGRQVAQLAIPRTYLQIRLRTESHRLPPILRRPLGRWGIGIKHILISPALCQRIRQYGHALGCLICAIGSFIHIST